jgi:hypothetical protein
LDQKCSSRYHLLITEVAIVVAEKWCGRSQGGNRRVALRVNILLHMCPNRARETVEMVEDRLRQDDYENSD